MKIGLRVKQFAVLLAILMLFQNCSIYRAREATIDEASTFPGKVKIKTTANESYKFNRLIKEDGKIYGVAKKNSKPVKELADNVHPESLGNKFVKILIPDNFIDKIHLKNRTLSSVLGVSGILFGVVLAGAGLLVLLLAGAF